MIKFLNIFILAPCMVLMFSCGNNNNDFDASGAFEATEIIVSAEGTGKIMQLNIQEGDILKLDQVVGYIDSIQLFLKKKQLLANIQTIEGNRPETEKQIAALKQQIVTAKTERQRIENLVNANAANKKQLDDINAQILVLEKQLAAQQSTLDIGNRTITGESESLEWQVAQINDQIAKCSITSPINGRVLAKYASKGEFTNMGRAIFKIADTDNMILKAYVTSSQLNKVKTGDKVKVFADFDEDNYKEYEGTITWVSDKSEFTPKTIQTKDERANLVYAVKIAVKNDGYIKIGMYGSLKFKI